MLEPLVDEYRDMAGRERVQTGPVSACGLVSIVEYRASIQTGSANFTVSKLKIGIEALFMEQYCLAQRLTQVLRQV